MQLGDNPVINNTKLMSDLFILDVLGYPSETSLFLWGWLRLDATFQGEAQKDDSVCWNVICYKIGLGGKS